MGHSDAAISVKDSKLRDYMQLTKPSLNIMVGFSSVICYQMAPRIVETEWMLILFLFIGGYLITGSANAINMAVEKDTDSQMKRTAKRPVASGRMSVNEAWAFAIISGAIGILILGYFFNWLSAGLALFSLFLYAFVYTPLKKVNAVAVLVGAFPGALPCLIGWAAGNDAIFENGHGWKDYGGLILFAIQFLWQFPHFWAIAWVAHKDYSSVGFKLLPAEKGPTKYTAMQSIVYAVLMLPTCILPYIVKLTEYKSLAGAISFAIVILANFFLVGQCVRLYREMDVKAARRVMFSSYIYLPVVFLALLASKA